MNGLAVASLVVLAVVSVIWTFALIAVALEIRRASWRLQEFIRSVELELKPTMQEAREAIRTLNRAAQSAADSTERVRGALIKLEQAGENVRAASGRIRTLFGSRFIPALSLLAGVRAGTKVLWNLYTRRRETK
jgi:ABC-type transporter Mla subunit MlaD